MKVHISKLKINLETDLKPIYLISGDEPLQFNEACDEIRSFCKANGYEDREIIEAGTSFDWSSLINQANSLSLFSKKKFIDFSGLKVKQVTSLANREIELFWGKLSPRADFC